MCHVAMQIEGVIRGGKLLTCLQAHLPDKILGTGDHFHHQRTLTRRLDSVITDLTSQRVAVLQMEKTQGYKRGAVSAAAASHHSLETVVLKAGGAAREPICLPARLSMLCRD